MTDPVLLTNLAPTEIADALGLKPFQSRQLFRWIHAKQVFDPEVMTDLSKDLRAMLRERCVVRQLELEQFQTSAVSGTRKALYRLRDGEVVESVLLRHHDRMTLCLSTQVGCPIGCAFCATGQAGFIRDLAPGEIVEQALHLLADEDLDGRTPNIVYMGMGEPFLNYDAMAKSIQLLMMKEGLGIGARKITVSTVGIVPGILRFSQEDWQVRLSISLHAADDELRNRLVPVNRKYPLQELRSALQRYQGESGRQFTFEWTLIRGVNDREEDIKRLIAYCRGLKVSVNVIPYNPVSQLSFETAAGDAARNFCDRLEQTGLAAVLREERGQDIDAACGQLRHRHAAIE